MDWQSVLKFNPNHDPKDGRFTSGDGGSKDWSGELGGKGSPSPTDNAGYISLQQPEVKEYIARQEPEGLVSADYAGKSALAVQRLLEAKYPDKQFQHLEEAYPFMVREVATSIDRMASLYPEQLKALRGVVVQDAQYGPKDYPNAWAWYQNGGIFLSSKYHSMTKGLDGLGGALAYVEQLKEGTRTGFHPDGGDTVGSVFVHEFGHFIQDIDKQSMARNNALLVSQLDDKFIKISDTYEPVSKYAAINANESFAEQFMYAHCSNQFGAKALREVFDLYFKNYYRFVTGRDKVSKLQMSAILKAAVDTGRVYGTVTKGKSFAGVLHHCSGGGDVIAKFDESQHPRVPAGQGDPSGEFTSGNGGTGTEGGNDPYHVPVAIKAFAQMWTKVQVPWFQLQGAAREVIADPGQVPEVDILSFRSLAKLNREMQMLTGPETFTVSTKAVLEYIEGVPPLKTPLYRGLHATDKLADAKVGDTFSESLTSWTGKVDLARDFATGEYGGDSTQNYNRDPENVLMIIEGHGMKGINVSAQLGPYDPVLLRKADEWLTSGEYRITHITQPYDIGHPDPHVDRDKSLQRFYGVPMATKVIKVERIGKAKIKNVVKADLAQADLDKGGRLNPELGPKRKKPKFRKMLQTTAQHELIQKSEQTVQQPLRFLDRVKKQFARIFKMNPNHAPPGSPAGGQFTSGDSLPAEPGSTPVKEGYVRLYHQTDASNIPAILKEGILFDKARGIEGPRAIYADEQGFYGKPGKVPTIEFQVPKANWDKPFVTIDVTPDNIIAAHVSWHDHARYIEKDPKLLADVLAGKHDDLLKEEDYGDAIRYIKSRYAKKADFAKMLKFDESEHPRVPSGSADGGEFTAGADRPQTKTPEFKAWFGNSKVVDANGKPEVVYHGSPNDIEKFERRRTSVESYFGAAFYFTSSRVDADANYSTVAGPDLANRIEGRASELAAAFEDKHPDAISTNSDRESMNRQMREQARADFASNEGAIYPMYLSMQKPLQIGGKDGTYLEYNQPMDKEGEYLDKPPTGKLAKLIEGLHKYGGDDANTAIESLVDRFGYSGGAASEVINTLMEDEKFGYHEDARGKLDRSEVLRKAIQHAGFDGIIDRDVNNRFGSRARGKPMRGVNSDTTHFIAFKPEQAKSALGNTTFNRKDKRITKGLADILKFDESKHPRVPSGSADGGEFTSIGSFDDFMNKGLSETRTTVRDHLRMMGIDSVKGPIDNKVLGEGAGHTAESFDRVLIAADHVAVDLKDRYGIDFGKLPNVRISDSAPSAQGAFGETETALNTWGKNVFQGADIRVLPDFKQFEDVFAKAKDGYDVHLHSNDGSVRTIHTTWTVGQKDATSPDNLMESTLRHEFGHVLAYASDIKAWAHKNMFEDGHVKDKLTMNKGWVAENISGYATTQVDELFAEVFAKYTHPGYVKGTLPPFYENMAKHMIKGGGGTVRKQFNDMLVAAITTAAPPAGYVVQDMPYNPFDFRAIKFEAVAKAFNENQPRDAHGRWTDAGEYIGEMPMGGKGFRASIPPMGYAFKEQVGQYPKDGPPGIGYFKGVVSKTKHVDVLLHRDEKGQITGILNHFPFEFPGMERKGNFNVFVDPAHTGKGIGKALVREGGKRFNLNLDQQEYTVEGAHLADSLVKPGYKGGYYDAKTGFWVSKAYDPKNPESKYPDAKKTKARKFESILKFNANHEPAGSSKGGQFASDAGDADLSQMRAATNKALDSYKDFSVRGQPGYTFKNARDVLTNYTGLGFHGVNDYASGKLSASKRYIEQVVDETAALDHLFETVAPIDHEVGVWRGVHNLKALDGMTPSSEMVGREFIEHRFISTSANKDKGLMFADGSDGGGVVFHYQVPKGTHVLTPAEEAGINYEEKEIILPRDSRFRVVSVEQVAAQGDFQKHWQVNAVLLGSDPQPLKPPKPKVLHTSKAEGDLSRFIADDLDWLPVQTSAKQRTLYVKRNLLNGDEFVAWAKDQGFTTALPDEELHVTIAFSKAKVDWDAMGDSFDSLLVKGGKRSVVSLGDLGAAVLKFTSGELSQRWQEFRDKGCSWDFPSYQPHITISFQKPDGLDLSKVEPFAGDLKLGPEVFAELDEDWKDGVVEKWDENEHPRDNSGRFSDKGGGGGERGRPLTPVDEAFRLLHIKMMAGIPENEPIQTLLGKILAATDLPLERLHMVDTMGSVMKVESAPTLMEPHRCYNNSIMHMHDNMMNTKIDTWYVEGVVLEHGVPISHAWNEEDGKYIDHTVPNGSSREYKGVRIPPYIAMTIATSRAFGSGRGEGILGTLAMWKNQKEKDRFLQMIREANQ